MKIANVADPSFAKYGRVIEGLDVAGLMAAMEKTPLPGDVVYEPSEPSLEALPVFSDLRDRLYGELPIQVGYCNGHNKKLNALEYHRSSEIDIAATDLILLLGQQQDIRRWSCTPPRCTTRPVRRTGADSAASSCCRRIRTFLWNAATQAGRTAI